MENYIKEKKIFISEHFYPCMVKGCKFKGFTSLNYEGNYCCMTHFIEKILKDYKLMEIDKK